MTGVSTPDARRPLSASLRSVTISKAIGWVLLAVAAVVFAALILVEEYRRFFIFGPGIVKGALVGAIALGIVLTYRGSGVVNFANGAVAMYAAYTYALLRRDGDLLLPPLPNPLAPIEALIGRNIVDFPTRISFGPNMRAGMSLVLTLLFCVVLGLALHFLIFRPLRKAPPLAKVVASVGLLLFLQAVIIRRFGTTAVQVPKLYDTQPVIWKFPGGVQMTREQFFVVVLVIALTVALWALFRFTRFGLATRAAAENEKGAVVLGFSPDFLAGANWVLSTVMAGLFGVIVASAESSVDPVTITFLVIPALSAALVGGFSSFGITTLTGFLLGMIVPVVQYAGTKDWFPKAAGGAAIPGVGALLPFLVIVAVLFLRGKGLPERGAVSAGKLPFSPTPGPVSLRIVGPVTVLVTLAFTFFLATPTWRLAVTNTVVGVVISLSFVVVTGMVGQISLAQMVLAGISGFILSKLTTEHDVPFPIAPLIGAFGALLVGLLVAIPALRVRGVNLAIVTFAFAVAMQEFLFKNPSINGGLEGAPINSPEAIDPLNDVPFDRGIGANPWFTAFCLAVAVALCYAVANLRRSGTGRRFLAARSNERAAAAAGVSVAGTKVIAFAVGSFIAGLAGALFAYRQGSVTQAYFGDVQSLTFFAFAYLGGIACVSGAVAAGFLVANGIVFTLLTEVFDVPSEFTLILGGLGLILTAVLNPEGVAGGVRIAAEQRRAKATAKAERSGRSTAAGRGSAAADAAADVVPAGASDRGAR